MCALTLILDTTFCILFLSKNTPEQLSSSKISVPVYVHLPNFGHPYFVPLFTHKNNLSSYPLLKFLYLNMCTHHNLDIHIVFLLLIQKMICGTSPPTFLYLYMCTHPNLDIHIFFSCVNPKTTCSAQWHVTDLAFQRPPLLFFIWIYRTYILALFSNLLWLVVSIQPVSLGERLTKSLFKWLCQLSVSCGKLLILYCFKQNVNIFCPVIFSLFFTTEI